MQLYFHSRAITLKSVYTLQPTLYNRSYNRLYNRLYDRLYSVNTVLDAVNFQN